MDGSEIVAVKKFQSMDIRTIENIFVSYPEIKKGIYYNSGQNYESIKFFLSKKLDYFIDFNYMTSIPIQNLYGTPETLGLDRLASVVGADSYFPMEKCMVIDLGTAITIDFLSEGKYLGGNISPGLQMRFKSLHHFTQKLPYLENSEEIKPIGANTKEAIISGVQLSILGEIDYYRRKFPEYKVLFTGGDAFYFVRKIKIPIFVVKNLTILGLNRILEYNTKQ